MKRRLIEACVIAMAWGCVGVSVAQAGVAGSILFRSPTGQLTAREAELTLPTDWQTPVTLRFGDDMLISGGFEVKGQQLGLVFQDLPYDASGKTYVVMRGEYQAGKRYFGEVFTIEAANIEDPRVVLRAAMQDSGLSQFAHAASFYFGKVETVGGIPVVRGRPLDINNPCPYGPCWADGGGRNLEYFPGGPIQNPGRARPAAGFNRGVPEEWTRDAQLTAQLVGVQRARMIYDYTHSYRNWGWGFFLFPWAGYMW